MHLPYQEILKLGPKLVSPFDDSFINSSSYDITLGKKAYYRGDVVSLEGGFLLRPGDFILTTSEQTWDFPCDLAGQLLLKSTLGRHGIDHMLAGWFDPDFKGEATMELVNNHEEPFELKAGQKIAQMVFLTLTEPTMKPYRIGGRYQGQIGATLPRKELQDEVVGQQDELWVAGPWIPSGQSELQYRTWHNKMVHKLNFKVNYEMSKLSEFIKYEINYAD